MAEVVHILRELGAFIDGLRKAQADPDVVGRVSEDAREQFIRDLDNFIKKLEDWRVLITPNNSLPREIEEVPSSEHPVQRLVAVLGSGIARLDSRSLYEQIQDEIKRFEPFLIQMAKANVLDGVSPTRSADKLSISSELSPPATTLQARLAGEARDLQPVPSVPAPQTTDEARFVLADPPDPATRQVHARSDGLVHWGIPDAFVADSLNNITGKAPKWRPPNWDERTEKERALLPENGKPAFPFQPETPAASGEPVVSADQLGPHVANEPLSPAAEQQQPSAQTVGSDVVAPREPVLVADSHPVSDIPEGPAAVEKEPEADQSPELADTRNLGIDAPPDGRSLTSSYVASKVAAALQGELNTPLMGRPATYGTALREDGYLARKGGAAAIHFDFLHRIAKGEIREPNWLEGASQKYAESVNAARNGQAAEEESTWVELPRVVDEAPTVAIPPHQAVGFFRTLAHRHPDNPDWKEGLDHALAAERKATRRTGSLFEEPADFVAERAAHHPTDRQPARSPAQVAAAAQGQRGFNPARNSGPAAPRPEPRTSRRGPVW